MARDLTIVSLAAGGLGVTSVLGLGVRGFSRQLLRSVGPIAYRMGARTAGQFARTVHSIARTLGFSVPRGAMRGVPRSTAVAAAGAATAAYNKMPPAAKKIVNQAAKKIRNAQRKPATKPRRSK